MIRANRSIVRVLFQFCLNGNHNKTKRTLVRLVFHWKQGQPGWFLIVFGGSPYVDPHLIGSSCYAPFIARTGGPGSSTWSLDKPRPMSSSVRCRPGHLDETHRARHPIFRTSDRVDGPKKVTNCLLTTELVQPQKYYLYKMYHLHIQMH